MDDSGDTDFVNSVFISSFKIGSEELNGWHGDSQLQDLGVNPKLRLLSVPFHFSLCLCGFALASSHLCVCVRALQWTVKWLLA